MRIEKKTFRIGDLAQALSDKSLTIEPSAIRFWEKEFNIRPKRSVKGQRYYSKNDFETFQTIKSLLYEKKFTIEGAKKLFKDKKLVVPPVPLIDTRPNQLTKKLLYLKTKLEKLKQLL